jgi:hypothetical protein
VHAASYALEFLGVSDANSDDVSAAVWCQDGAPRLLIDLGPGVLRRFETRFARIPDAVFVTHVHLDHIADFERLFYALKFRGAGQYCKLFLPVGLLRYFHARLAEFPSLLAEGGANFYDVFQCIPVSEGFWLAGQWFDCPAVQHHGVGTAFGLHLAGSFFYTGDTRPIAPLLQSDPQALIFHDVSLRANPSHTGLDELLAYPPEVLSRLRVYHLNGPTARAEALGRGLKVAETGQAYPLPTADPNRFVAIP